MLLMLQMKIILEACGHVVVATAETSNEAMSIAAEMDADLALIDVHLADGPTGPEVGRFLVERTKIPAVFVTANPKMLPSDFSGALGAIAKPYTKNGLILALDYLLDALSDSRPRSKPPRSLILAPNYAERWCGVLA